MLSVKHYFFLDNFSFNIVFFRFGRLGRIACKNAVLQLKNIFFLTTWKQYRPMSTMYSKIVDTKNFVARKK